LALVLLQVRLNLWIADLFDSLERRSTDRFLAQVAVFAAIVTGTVLASAAYQVVKRQLQLSWRDWLTTRVIGAWLDRARHYRLALAPGAHEHPDGRIAEDIRIATEWAVELAQTLLYCAATLAGFVGILWSLSGLVFVGAVPVHGHLVWVALLYAALGSAAAFTLGRRLVRATDARQGMEAGFRVGLVRAREAAEPIALACAEAAERRRLARLFAGVAVAWHRQTVSLARLTLFTSGYAVLTPVFAILFATPRYLIGTITLGELMQTGQAFQQVTNSLSWPIDQFPRIAEWRASVERVLALTTALARLKTEDAPGVGAGVDIERTEEAGLNLVISDLEVTTAEGATAATGIDLSVAPGERVLVSGDPGVLTALFRALAGLWPWSHGRVVLPRNCVDGALAFVGPRPWLSEGEPLRHVLCFPRDAADLSDAALANALVRVGLPLFADRLDAFEAWDRVLTPGDQQRLAIARLLVQRPAWVVLHNATDALDPQSEADLTCILAEALPDATMLVLGRPAVPAELFGRRLTLEHADQSVLRQDGRARNETHTTAQPSPGSREQMHERLDRKR
jgi:putative ATP-binding cassette transporter